MSRKELYRQGYYSLSAEEEEFLPAGLRSPFCNVMKFLRTAGFAIGTPAERQEGLPAYKVRVILKCLGCVAYRLSDACSTLHAAAVSAAVKAAVAAASAASSSADGSISFLKLYT